MRDRSSNLCSALTTALLAAAILPLSGCETEANTKPATPAVANMALPFCVNEECGVVDLSGKVLAPFTDKMTFSIDRPDRYLVALENGWQLFDLSGKVLLKAEGQLVMGLGDGVFTVGDEEIGFMLYNADGKALINEPTGGFTAGGTDEYIAYTENGLWGVMDRQGKRVRPAEYDSIYTNGNYYNLASNAGFILAEKQGKNWLIDFKKGTEQEVPFSSMKALREGVMLVEQEENEHNPMSKYGLLNSSGKLVLPMQELALYEPSNGLVEFKGKDDGNCGYMDFTGKVVIEAKFLSCEAFGKQFALARDPETQKTGLIKRDGSWQTQPEWDDAASADYSALGNIGFTPGLATTYKQGGLSNYTMTLINTDTGKPITKGDSYTALGALGDHLLTFGTKDAKPSQVELLGSIQTMPGMGIMDKNEKVLLKSEGYGPFWIDPTKTLLTAVTPDQLTHVFDANTAKPIAMMPTPQLQVRKDLGLFFAFDMERDVSQDMKHHRFWGYKGAYRLDGTRLLQVHRLPCGAQQLKDGAGKVIWPAKPEQFCPPKES